MCGVPRRLTQEDVKFIRENYEFRGEFNSVFLGKKYGVSWGTIRNVVNFKCYK